MGMNVLDKTHRVKGEPDCEECGGVGIIPPGTRAVRLCGCRAWQKDLEGVCGLIAAKMVRLNPDWKVKMHAVMDERHWNYTQMVGACIAYVYERGLQMTMPNFEFFAEGSPETPEVGTCALEGCGKQFTPRWMGDKFCCNEHGALALPKRKVIVEHRNVEPLEINPDQGGIVPSVTISQEQAEEQFPIHSGHDEFADV